MSGAGLSTVALSISVVIPELHEQERINGLIEHLEAFGHLGTVLAVCRTFRS